MQAITKPHTYSTLQHPRLLRTPWLARPCGSTHCQLTGRHATVVNYQSVRPLRAAKEPQQAPESQREQQQHDEQQQQQEQAPRQQERDLVIPIAVAISLAAYALVGLIGVIDSLSY